MVPVKMLEKAQKIIQVTTQRVIMTMFPSPLYFLDDSEQMIIIFVISPGTTSVLRHFYCQCSLGWTISVHRYTKDFVWTKVHPVASRIEAHETLFLHFGRDGVPPACMCENAKEMIQGKFYQKHKDAAYQLKQFKSYNPRTITAEKIKELKKWLHGTKELVG